MSEASTVTPAVSVVVPVRNEAGNVAPLVAEITVALEGRWPFEVIYVNDGSSDGTEAELRSLMAARPWLRQIRHARSCGQSAALRSGVSAARAPLIATLDGDGQNDPAFLPKLIEALHVGSPRVGLVAGQRVGRKASGFKKFQSRVANAVRGTILRDGTRDTGCGLKAFDRDMFLALPYFDGLHRFLPALARREGRDIGYVDVVATAPTISAAPVSRASAASRASMSGSASGAAGSAVSGHATRRAPRAAASRVRSS
jgi:glycosyltransferase involved in cell wall biosynthesis